ncbi:MAG: hypothetical protein HOW97_13705, partial [Catenulispora sp.]|nr:hypothetical protein [Catenulispora sp.]
ASALGALVTAAVVHATTASAAATAVQPRSRLGAAHAAVPASAAVWPVILAAVVILAATQAAVVHRDRLRQLVRRLTARSSA